eukprot:g20249.t1
MRHCEELRTQIESLQRVDAEEEQLLLELKGILSSRRKQQLESVCSNDETEQADSDCGPSPSSLPRGRRLSRRLSLGSVSRNDTYLVSSPAGPQNNRGVRKNAVMSSLVDDESFFGASPVDAKQRGGGIGFSSRLKRMFSKDSDVISEDAEDPDDYELAIPQLPEIDIASIDVMQPSSEEDASVVNPDIEAAMTAKIKPSGKPRVEGLMGSGVSTTAPMVKNNPTASSNRHAVYTPSTEAPEEEQMEAIWQHIRNSDCESGGTNVRVAIRMRPLNARELELQSRRCMAMVDGCEVIVEDEDATQEHRYNFDFCFDASAPDDDGSAGGVDPLELSLEDRPFTVEASYLEIYNEVNEDPTTKIINDLRNEVLRLRGQLSLSQQSAGGGDAARISPDVKSSLLHAEEALRNYAKQWEAKQQSMRFVKSKLLKKRCAAFGAADLEESEIDSTPFLLSLSSDPLLDMAVKVFIPPGAILRIGRRGAVDV